jgi:hypothetical protein
VDVPLLDFLANAGYYSHVPAEELAERRAMLEESFESLP